MDSYDSRLALVRDACSIESERFGFARYSGSSAAKHIILGVTHESHFTPVSLTLMVESLLVGRTGLLVERPLDRPNFTVDSLESLAANSGNLEGWQREVVPKLLEGEGAFVSYDASRLLRQSIELQNDKDAFIGLCVRREYRFATLFEALSKKYDRVIGVFGSAHVVSPIFDAVLANIDHARYIFTAVSKD